MASPEIGSAWPRSPAIGAAPGVGSGGPCAPARASVDTRCADAERLAAAAQAHEQAVHDARREHGDAVRMRDNDTAVRDRRRVAEQKAAAQADYHAAMLRATDQASVHEAAAIWLRRIDDLNRDARIADERADGVAQRVRDLERALPGLEMAADAARIASEAAQASCLEARRALAACEEGTQRLSNTGAGLRTAANGATAVPTADRQRAAAPPWSSTGALPLPPAVPLPPVAPLPPAAPLSPPQRSAENPGDVARAARVLVQGDRQLLLGLARRLAEETGFQAGRMQLLLLDLREQITESALEDMAVAFPADHPFWSQFNSDDARRIAASLASMGYRFDGRSGWTDGRAPQVRDLAMALSYCGYDPRSLRSPAGQAALERMWLGTTLRTEEYLLARAPNLALTQVVAFLGARSGRLSELWDLWGRLRPLLMRAGASSLS